MEKTIFDLILIYGILYFSPLEMIENNQRLSTNYEDGGGTLTTNFHYRDNFENNHYGSDFSRNSHLRASTGEGASFPGGPPLRTFNNNHYANLQVEDQITCNIQRPEDKKLLFKVPFPTSFKATKSNGAQCINNGAGPLTKPPPSFLQPKSKYASNVGMESSSHQSMYQESPLQQIYYQGRTIKSLNATF